MKTVQNKTRAGADSKQRAHLRAVVAVERYYEYVRMNTVIIGSELNNLNLLCANIRGREQLHLHIQIAYPRLSSRNSVSNDSLITQVN